MLQTLNLVFMSIDFTLNAEANGVTNRALELFLQQKSVALIRNRQFPFF